MSIERNGPNERHEESRKEIDIQELVPSEGPVGRVRDENPVQVLHVRHVP